MSLRFFLIDDDAATCRMLEKIIAESHLGEVVGQARDGLTLTADQLAGIDVVLIDFLMPGKDGIETIKKLRGEGFSGRFIMISQVNNKEMIGDAYVHGIDTFIQKPINRLEVLAVLKRVAEHLTLVDSLNSIRQSLNVLDEKVSQSLTTHTMTLENKVRHLLLQLGIAGDTGARDILLIMQWLFQSDKGKALKELPPLKQLYRQVIQHHTGKQGGDQLQKEVRTMEQRIRRIVLKAFSNLASLGVTDYANPTFEGFAPKLFDFHEVRLRMREIEQGQLNTTCRISVRKFLTAFYMEVKQLS